MPSSRPDVPDDAVGAVTIPRARLAPDSLQRLRTLPPALLPMVSAAVRALPDQAATRIRTEVPAFAGPRHDGAHRRIRESVKLAVDGFFLAAAGDLDSWRQVEAAFRGLGRSEEAIGGGQRVLAALQVALDTAWHSIRDLAVHEQLTGRAVADLGAALSGYLGTLSTAVQQGMAEQRLAMRDPRTQLVLALLGRSTERGSREVDELAVAASWAPPEQVVVVTGELAGGWPRGRRDLPGDGLAWTDGDRLVVITVEEAAPDVVAALLAAGPLARVAQSWSVPLDAAGHAYRWTRRALDLIRRGELRPDGRVVLCVQHRMMLWLAADPALAADLSCELLAPLETVRGRRRLSLAETLLAWLETDESAPLLAQRLSLHANTVRSHLAVLRELFGDRLRQADGRAALILALEATLPRWRAESPAR